MEFALGVAAVIAAWLIIKLTIATTRQKYFRLAAAQCDYEQAKQICDQNINVLITYFVDQEASYISAGKAAEALDRAVAYRERMMMFQGVAPGAATRIKIRQELHAVCAEMAERIKTNEMAGVAKPHQGGTK